MIDAKALAEENGTLTMVNNGTGDCMVALLNAFPGEQIYLDQFWTDSAYDPIEMHDEENMVLNFTKFYNPGQFYLKERFYKIILPPETSFTAIGHENKLN